MDYIEELNLKYKKKNERAFNGAVKFHKQFFPFIDEDVTHNDDKLNKAYNNLKSSLHREKYITKDVLIYMVQDLLQVIRVQYSHYKIEVELSGRSEKDRQWSLERMNETIKIYLHLSKD